MSVSKPELLPKTFPVQPYRMTNIKFAEVVGMDNICAIFILRFALKYDQYINASIDSTALMNLHVS